MQAYLLLVALLAAAAGRAAAAPALVGCFAPDALKLVPGTSATLDASATALPAACSDRCSGLKHALAAVRAGGGCACGDTVPAAALSEAACGAGAGEGAATLYYAHADSAATCHLSNLGPLGPANVEASYNPFRLKYSPGAPAGEGGLALELAGTDVTRAVTSDGDFLYGMWQWDVLPSPAVGAVTGAYLRSDYMQETKDFSEIDWEFVNGGAKEQGGASPGSIWLNILTDGRSRGEMLVLPSRYGPVIGLAPGGTISSGGDYHTYTIDWQPTHVSWKVDGQVLEHRVKGQNMSWSAWDGPKTITFEPPNKPCHMTMSMWSHPIEGFGGANQGTTYSRFKELRRILCSSAAGTKLPLPAAPATPDAIVQPVPGAAALADPTGTLLRAAAAAAGDSTAAAPRTGGGPMSQGEMEWGLGALAIKIATLILQALQLQRANA